MNYFHLSYDNQNGKMFKPRIPSNRIDGEDGKIKRICVSTSIVGCLRAITDTMSFYRWKDEEFYVHVPLHYTGKIIKPTKAQVPDVYCTKEKWLIEKARMHCIGKIRVCIINKPDPYYNTSISYRFKWIDKYTEKPTYNIWENIKLKIKAII